MNNTKYLNIDYGLPEVSDLRELMNNSVERHGSRPAYLVKDKPGGAYRPVSYREFRRDVTAFGTALLDMGLHGRKVAVIGENRYEWIVTYMAVTCGGGVIVPLDKELPAEEVAGLIERAEVSAIVYSGKMGKALEDIFAAYGDAGLRISMDAEDDSGAEFSMKKLMGKGYKLLEAGRREFFETEIDPDSMCSLLFTSGTTGLAKGVMLSHRNIASNVVAMSRGFCVERWTSLAVLPMHHTYSLTCDIMATMYQGCTVAICEGLKYILKNLAESKANLMLAVPLMLEKMHQRIFKQAESKGKLSTLNRALAISKALNLGETPLARKLFKEVHESLGGHMKMFISGGAAVSPTIIKDFNAMGILALQGYGLTESSPIIAVNRDRCHRDAAAGTTMRGTEIKIIEPDEDGVGEIIARSPSVMLGYYGDPEKTAEVLRDGWLHTGDYGRFDKDGFLYVTGRKKDVIVTKNGKNIFPEEVEFYLLQSPYIAEAVVWGFDDEKMGDTVVCADIFPDYNYIGELHEDNSEAGIRNLLDREVDAANEKMPFYKHIKRFSIRKEEFEKTTTQKIKRHKVTHEN